MTTPTRMKGMWLTPAAPALRERTLYQHWHPVGWWSRACFWLARRLLRNAWFETEPDNYTTITTSTNNQGVA